MSLRMATRTRDQDNIAGSWRGREVRQITGSAGALKHGGRGKRPRHWRALDGRTRRPKRRAAFRVEYGGGIDDQRHKPRRTARELARAVEGGRDVGAALRHLDGHGSEPGAVGVAEALARFLVARCDSHHAGWRVVRQVVVDSAADAPWERCARRAVPLVSEDLLRLAGDVAGPRWHAPNILPPSAAPSRSRFTLIKPRYSRTWGWTALQGVRNAGAWRSRARSELARASRSPAPSIARFARKQADLRVALTARRPRC